MIPDWWAVRDLNTRPSGCKPDALTAELTAPAFRFYRLAGPIPSVKRNCPKIVRDLKTYDAGFHCDPDVLRSALSPHIFRFTVLNMIYMIIFHEVICH
jgi:hypothetical protein